MGFEHVQIPLGKYLLGFVSETDHRTMKWLEKRLLHDILDLGFAVLKVSKHSTMLWQIYCLATPVENLQREREL